MPCADAGYNTENAVLLCHAGQLLQLKTVCIVHKTGGT